jgi:hypothetical protein
VPARGGVGHHQVVVALADLEGELAHGEDLTNARGGGRHEVEGAGQRRDPRRERAGTVAEVKLDAQVLLQRLLGAHRHGEEPGLDLSRLEADRRRLEDLGQIALGVDLAGQDPLAPLGRQQGEGRGHRGLARSPLAGDEEQPALEEVVPHRRPLPSAVQRALNPTRRSPVSLPIST